MRISDWSSDVCSSDLVDIISNGRLDWGVGKGYDKLEFASYGVPFDEREERWEETFDAVQTIWRTKETAYSGEFYELGAGELLPPPLQRPLLPIYAMVSNRDESIEWAAERLLPVAIGSGPDWYDIRHQLPLYGQTAAKHGYADLSIRETLDRCWQPKQVHVAATTDRKRNRL